MKVVLTVIVLCLKVLKIMYLKRFRFTLCCSVILSIVFAILPSGASEMDEPCNCNFFKDARFEVGYSAGQFIGDKNYGELGLFLPTAFSDQWTIFADARGYAFQHSRWGASAGMGMRGIVCGDRILGGNLYYDYLDRRRESSVGRIGIGLEWLGSSWDARFNGYCPFSGPGFKCTYSKGFDAELGAPVFCWRGFEIYVAAGPYFYGSTKRKDSRRAEDFWGGFGRLEVNWRDYISLQVRTSYDRHYHSHTQFRALLSVPFEVLCSWQSFDDYCDNLLTQPVERNNTIFERHHCH